MNALAQDGFILAVNVGSTSLRHALYRVRGGRLQPGTVVRGHRQQLDGVRDFAQALEDLREDMRQRSHGWPLLAVAHRVVHGGADVHAPVVVSPLVMRHLEACESMAPLHQPFNLMGIRLFAEYWPSIAQIACPDTAFHVNMPAAESAFALPRALREQGYRRYGFHGLSCESALCTLKEHGQDSRGRLVVAHLGSGSSVTAIHNERSVATSMGFSTLDGLVMATRCGSLDPGVLLSLMDKGWTRSQLQDLLYLDSGLKGLSGISGDIRILRARASLQSRFAIEVYVRRLLRETGALVACMGGLDGLIFTGGAGEADARLRADIAGRLAWLGLQLDAGLNDEADVGKIATPLAAIHAKASSMKAWVVAADENRVAAAAALACLLAINSPAH